MAEYSKYSEVSPQWTEFAAHYPELDTINQVSAVDRRRIFDEIVAAGPIKELPPDIVEDSLTIETFTIKARDGYDIPVRSYVPNTATAPDARPVLVYIHSGGFLFGDLESGHLNCQVLSAKLDLSILNVDHRLAPKWPFPYGVNDSYDAVEWVSSNAGKSLNANPAAGFLVGGISSGANFAGVIAYTARDAGLSPPITGLFISIPVALMPQAYHLAPSEWREQLLSLEQNGNAPLLTRQSLAQLEDLYKSPPEDLRISYLLNKDHTNLPTRAYFQICGLDLLRDETFLWQKLLQRHSSTKSKIHLYSGLPHGFWRFLQLEASKEWLDDLVEGIRFLLLPQDEFVSTKETDLTVKGL
ncbi:hypothetical protein V2A60_000165 [Cordyceps javanica]